jgi:hypothetical protein
MILIVEISQNSQQQEGPVGAAEKTILKKCPDGFAYVSIAINREARKALRQAAAESEVPIYLKLHEALCRGLGRNDLIHLADPATRHSASA